MRILPQRFRKIIWALFAVSVGIGWWILSSRTRAYEQQSLSHKELRESSLQQVRHYDAELEFLARGAHRFGLETARTVKSVEAAVQKKRDDAVFRAIQEEVDSKLPMSGDSPFVVLTNFTTLEAASNAMVRLERSGIVGEIRPGKTGSFHLLVQTTNALKGRKLLDQQK